MPACGSSMKTAAISAAANRTTRGESCTHGSFVPDGSKMIYVSYKEGGPNRYIRSLDPATLRDDLIITMPPCSHLMSNPPAR